MLITLEIVARQNRGTAKYDVRTSAVDLQGKTLDVKWITPMDGVCLRDAMGIMRQYNNDEGRAQIKEVFKARAANRAA